MRNALRTLVFAAGLLLVSVASAQSPRTHRVKSGDTLHLLSVQHGVSIDALKRLNGLRSDVIRIGQVLVVSGLDRVPTAPPALIIAETDSATGQAFGRYTVQPGDSMFELAFRLGLHPDSLRVLNPDPGVVLEPGTRLRVPIRYATKQIRVAAGETLFGIARRHGTTLRTLKATNNLTSDRIRVGQRLRVPANVAAPAPGRGLPDTVQEGLASVFPERYANRLMAGGEVYDPSRFHAAHRTLPLGAILLVTAGNRSTFVVVADRMPEETESILEISSAAAEALAFSGGRVALRVLDDRMP